ncbi:MAG TPA: polysaccharide deacetylase family protein [Chitinivibrionales bacterium]
MKLFALPLLAVLSCVNSYAPSRLFQIPVVVITFDDAHPSVYHFAFSAMRRMDGAWAATHFFPSSFAGQNGSTTVEQAREMEKAGWETGGHCVTHENLSSLPLDSVEPQIQGDYNFLTDNKLAHESFAYPFGNYNDTVKTVVKKYFRNIRTSHDFDYLSGIDRTELGYYAVKQGCAAQDIIARVEHARAVGSALVIIGFHAVIADSTASRPPASYWCTESVFTSFLQYLHNEEFPVLTLSKALDMLCN